MRVVYECKKDGEKEKETKKIIEDSLCPCVCNMFDFMFTMPAKLSVYLPVAVTVGEKERKKNLIIPYSNMFTSSSALQGVV